MRRGKGEQKCFEVGNTKQGNQSYPFYKECLAHFWEGRKNTYGKATEEERSKAEICLNKGLFTRDGEEILKRVRRKNATGKSLSKLYRFVLILS